jgi:hypothetical protein
MVADQREPAGNEGTANFAALDSTENVIYTTEHSRKNVKDASLAELVSHALGCAGDKRSGAISESRVVDPTGFACQAPDVRKQ